MLHALASACLIGVTRLHQFSSIRQLHCDSRDRLTCRFCRGAGVANNQVFVISLCQHRLTALQACYLHMAMWRGISLTIVAFARSVLEGGADWLGARACGVWAVARGPGR